jgi:hypothetical protein
MIKYETLIKILDNICKEAPATYKSYYPDINDCDKVIAARSKAFIHLYLKVICGVSSFNDRNDLITDGVQDGGIDGYFIDSEKKRLYLIQSKFRSTKNNFEEKSIQADELVKMEVAKILRGEEVDSNGIKFNPKIIQFQEKWRVISDHAHYEYIVIILGNLTKYNDQQIKRLIDSSKYEIFDFRKTYNELVFPLCSGTYYDPKEIQITINLHDEEPSCLKEKIKTKYGDFQVKVLFVPASEIGRILSKYKNAILKYNPRNYLSLSQNKVNQNIRDSILNYNTNDFAVFNNGITIICDLFKMSGETGTKNIGQIILTNPQIINGGQTAYTLSNIYETHKQNLNEVFHQKEVLLKVIVKTGDEFDIKFIEEISNATNQQSRVEEADRRSNEPIQLEIQKLIYEDFGYLYERKKGEFFNGVEGNYMDKEHIINRYNFLRAFLAFSGQSRWARQRGSETLFKADNFRQILKDPFEYRIMLFSYLVLKRLYEIEKEKDQSDWGFGLRYGKMAIIYAIALSQKMINVDKGNIHDLVNQAIKNVYSNWKKFENIVKRKDKSGEDFDFDLYYKGKTVDNDLIEFFGKKIDTLLL